MEVNCIQKEIENSLFNFIDDELKSIHTLNIPSRTVVYNEVVNFVEDKIISLFENNEEYDIDIDEVVIENEELEEQVYNLQNGFEELKSDVADDFESIQSYLEDADTDSVGSMQDVINKLREFVKYKDKEYRNRDIYD